MFDVLKKLCELPGISGDESAVRELLLQEVSPYADDCTVDRMGNLIVFKKGAARPQTRLMLCAHMDEVGLIVTTVTDEGYLRVAPVGGIDPRVVLGRRVWLPKSGLRGVTGTKAVHLQDPEERKTAPSFDKLLIDIGASSREEALTYVSPGDTAVFDSDYTEFGDGYIKARALDDRMGCAILAALLREPLPYDCHFVFTVQEEVGLRGAKTASFSVAPEAAIVVETTTAADIAGVAEDKKVCRLGQGAVLSFMDNRTMYDRSLFELAQSIAAEHDIPSQVKLAVAGGNDAGAVHISNDGVRTLAVSLPCRYLHSPSCVIRREDAVSTYSLVKELAAQAAGGALC